MAFSALPHQDGITVGTALTPTGHTRPMSLAVAAFRADTGPGTPAAGRPPIHAGNFPPAHIPALNQKRAGFPEGQSEFVPGRLQDPPIGGARNAHDPRGLFLVDRFQVRQTKGLDLVQAEAYRSLRIDFGSFDRHQCTSLRRGPHHSVPSRPSTPTSPSLSHRSIFRHLPKKNKTPEQEEGMFTTLRHMRPYNPAPAATPLSGPRLKFLRKDL